MLPFLERSPSLRAHYAPETDRERRAREFSHERMRTTPGYPDYANQRIQDMKTDYLANAGIPLVSDAAGAALDVDMYINKPESRTLGNALQSIAGAALPFVAGAAAIRPVRTASGDMASMDIMENIMDEGRWLDRGLKVGNRKKVYRGAIDDPYAPNNIGDDSLAQADFGRGLYTTTDKSQAKQYGTVHELGLDALPQNPIRFRDAMAYQNWKYNLRDKLGYKRPSDLSQAYDYDDMLVRDIDPDIDGVQIGEGAGTFFVKFPD